MQTRFGKVSNMSSAEALKQFFQRRYRCNTHGFFDVFTTAKPVDGSKAPCPECREPAFLRDGYECEGRTARTLPFTTKPRLSNEMEFEFPAFDGGKFRKPRRKKTLKRKAA